MAMPIRRNTSPRQPRPTHRARAVWLCLLAAALGILSLRCGRSNPFTDIANADAIVAGGMSAGDTVEVFGAESLIVLFTAWELLDSVTFSAPGNRVWPRPDSTVRGARLSESPFVVHISFYDTGLHSIEWSAYTANGPARAHSREAVARLPLHQQPVIAMLGDSITLRTSPARDRDISYFWSFSAGEQYVSPICSMRTVLRTPLLSGTGRVWVSDGARSSPAAPFSFAIQDTLGPTIICVNEGFVGADTILTADTLFDFRVRITDQQDGWVDSASIDGAPFDGSAHKTYHRLLERMDRYPPESPRMVTVYALDHFVHGNETARPFWIAFIDSLASARPLSLRLTVPARDSAIVSIAPYRLFGEALVHAAHASLSARAALEFNGAPLGDTIALDSANTAFGWNLPLAPGINTAAVRAWDATADTLLDSAERTLFYVAGYADTVAPLIISITADGKPAHGLYTTRERVTAGVQVYDEGSGVDSVFLGDQPMQASADNPARYAASVDLAHAPGGNELFVAVVDREGNRASASAVVFRNRKAVAQRLPAPAYIFTDSLFADTVVAFDPDGDSLRVEKTAGPDSLVVAANGALRWRPSPADTGKHVIGLRIWDGFQPVHASFVLYVTPAGITPPGPATLAVTPRDFPSFLEVGRDSLDIALSVKPNTGIAPFRYTARIVGAGGYLLERDTAGLLRWTPAIADTGYRQLIVFVEDAFVHRDTLYPLIKVIPPNRPCSLSVSFGADTTAEGALDLNGLQRPDTLRYRIHDPDDPGADRYTVTLYQSRVKTISVIDSAIIDTFSLILDPSALNGLDTVVAIVLDDRGRADTLSRAVNYGAPPETPLPLTPARDDTVSVAPEALQWSCVDPDSDPLWFDIEFGPADGAYQRIGTTTQRSFAISDPGPGTYRWRVLARDWKSATAGPWFRFTVE
jgi:hypothetical protein